MVRVFSTTPRIVMGRGSIKTIGAEVKRKGATRILIVTDKGVVSSGILKPIEESLKASRIKYSIYDKVEPDPRYEIVADCLEAVKQARAQLLIGVGGGSPMDISKTTAVMVTNKGPIKLYFGTDLIPKPGLPVILVPTTAGTGSEVTFASVITDTEKNYKFSMRSSKIAAKVALLDPELTLTVPPAVTASTGIDALTHAIEGYTATVTEPIAEAVGLYAVEMIAANIVEAVHNGSNLGARSEMLLGSLLGGISFSHSDVASVHCMAESLGGMYDAPHGLCNAILLPYVMEYNLQEAEYKYARVARAMGIKEDDDRRAAVLGIEKIRALSKEIGLPSFKSLNVKEEDLEKLALLSEENMSTESNPRKIDRVGYLELFKKAHKG